MNTGWVGDRFLRPIQRRVQHSGAPAPSAVVSRCLDAATVDVLNVPGQSADDHPTPVRQTVTTQPTFVIAPTTGGLIHVCGITPRSRQQLNNSFAVIKGDFRPLKMSGDYHRLASGPMALAGVADTDVVYELALSGDIDSGRSWELPIVIAHLLRGAGCLTTAAEAIAPDEGCPADEAAAAVAAGDTSATAQSSTPRGQSSPARPRVIWATGSVDNELSPQAGDFSVRTKTALSLETLARYRDAGADVQVIVSAQLPPGDLSHLAGWAGEAGFAFTPVATVAELRSVAGCQREAEAQSPPPPQSPFNTQSASEARREGGNGATAAQGRTGESARPNAIREAVPETVTVARVLLGTAGLLLLGSLGYYGLIATGKQTSTPQNGRSTGQAVTTTDAGLVFAALRAADRNDCIERMLVRQPFDVTMLDAATPDASQPNAQRIVAIDRTGGLCGMRVTNRTGVAQTVRLDPVLQEVLIGGTGSNLGLQVMPPSADSAFLFRKLPSAGDYSIVTIDAQDASRRYTVRFEGGSEPRDDNQ